jgi:hypothetical protein
MAFVNHPMEEEEKTLWYYASPQLEDIKVQKSDLILEAIEYKIKPLMIEMAEANPFRGVKTDNTYSTSSVSQCYATRFNKKEFQLIGTNVIFFHTHLRIKRNDGTHLHPSRWKKIRIDW